MRVAVEHATRMTGMRLQLWRARAGSRRLRLRWGPAGGRPGVVGQGSRPGTRRIMPGTNPEPGSSEYMRLQAEAVERDLAEHGVEYFLSQLARMLRALWITQRCRNEEAKTCSTARINPGAPSVITSSGGRSLRATRPRRNATTPSSRCSDPP
jgi:hypothetical protein